MKPPAGTVTDANGRFHIHGLCDGKYSVDVRHIGCQTVSKVVEIAGNVELDFKLHHTSSIPPISFQPHPPAL